MEPGAKTSCQEPFASPDDMHKAYPEFSANSRNFVNYDGPLFKDSKKGDYHLLKAFAASKAAVLLPSDISKLLGLSQTDAQFIGAYPPLP